MIHGRRITKSEYEKPMSSDFEGMVDKGMQLKYLWYMVTAVVGGQFVFLLPTFYFVSQNYNLFKTLAYDTQPQFVKMLEHEYGWLQVLLAISFTFILSMTLFLSHRLTKNLLEPLTKMKSHLQQLSRGQWDIADFEVDEESEYKELGLTYEYFYRSLKASTETELQLLKQLRIDPRDRQSVALWKQLVELKESKLGGHSEFSKAKLALAEKSAEAIATENRSGASATGSGASATSASSDESRSRRRVS